MSKLGIISDTHGRLNETVLAVRIFREHNVRTIIHCGDIGSLAIVRIFQKIPTHFVLGNMDGNDETFQSVIEETGNNFHGRFGTIEQAGKRIAFLHGDDTETFDKELASGNWDLLCYGHTHVAELHQQGSTLLLNPGAFTRVSRPTIAIVTLPELTVERFSV